MTRQSQVGHFYLISSYVMGGKLGWVGTDFSQRPAMLGVWGVSHFRFRGQHVCFVWDECGHTHVLGFL